VVGGELAISWVRVLRVEGGAILVRAKSSCASGVCARNCKMSNARVVFEIEAEGRANQMAENKRERVASCGGEERESVCQVLDPDRNPRTIVVIIHKEAINQFPGMAYFGGVFSGGEVSVRAMNYIQEGQYLVRATRCGWSLDFKKVQPVIDSAVALNVFEAVF
jgi:hypothetical protein